MLQPLVRRIALGNTSWLVVNTGVVGARLDEVVGDELDEVKVLARHELSHAVRLLLFYRRCANFGSAPVEHLRGDLADFHAHVDDAASSAAVGLLAGLEQTRLDECDAKLLLVRRTYALDLGLVPEADEPLELVEGENRGYLALLILEDCISDHEPTRLEEREVSVLEVGNLVRYRENLDGKTASISFAGWLEKLEALSGAQDLHLNIGLARLGRVDQGPQLASPGPLGEKRLLTGALERADKVIDDETGLDRVASQELLRGLVLCLCGDLPLVDACF